MPSRSRHSLTSLAPAGSLFWPLQLGGWLAFGVAMALSRVGRYPIDYMIATKLALTAIGFVLSLGLSRSYRDALRGHFADVL
jgi:hypothetical protein